jgi:GT2 family glycosyltransferase/glycosyltransferase involved in cell wall biosynthesis
MRRLALVSQTRVPEIDRDRGSQRVDECVRWLLDGGWSVSFLAAESDGDAHHAHRLRQLGVATYIGYEHAPALLAAAEFDLALLAFWQPASRLLPLIRDASRRTRVIVDSIDLHFLRDARRLIGSAAPLDDGFGARIVGELNTYAAADAVLTVSDKESQVLADFAGRERIYDLPLGAALPRSTVPFAQRSGMLFVGNFRHIPNGEAVEHLCLDILPRLDPDLLEAHPLAVVGSRLDDKVRACARGLSGVEMIGWVPSVQPYLERARVCVVPLLHGAGVKGKVLEALMAGTPVVTTSVGAEGLNIRHGEHALIADSPAELAAAIALLLSDEDEWRRIADTGRALAAEQYAEQDVRARFDAIVDEVLAKPPRASEDQSAGVRRAQRRELAYRETLHAATETLQAITDPGEVVLVVSRGDERLTAIEGRHGWHFPQTAESEWAGSYPADSADAIAHLEALRERGARYLALPSTAFWWLHHYRELNSHLEARYRRIHSGEHLIVFDLGSVRERRDGSPVAGERARVLVLGTYAAHAAGPPPALVAELERSERFAMTQHWRRGEPGGPPAARSARAGDESDWILFVDDTAVLPAGFVDDFLGAAASLEALGVVRAQPAHADGPGAGPPATERQLGVFARELDAVTRLPLLALRGGASATGPTAIVDETPIRLAGGRLPGGGDEFEPVNVRDVFTMTDGKPARAVQRSAGRAAPAISVILSTYARPDLLRMCLDGFCDQTLDPGDFEVVVVDDGSPGDESAALLREFAAGLPLTWVHIAHSGRSAAKNLAVLLARGELVLFADDDDRPAPDLLERHVQAHARHPDLATAILGHTSWAPELEVTPVMHYLTEVDKLLFAYGNLKDGQLLDWRGFWEGRVSSKRQLHLRHGLHDQRLEYSIDVEMGWRLARHGLRVIYDETIETYMTRAVSFEDFCKRYEAKGRAQAAIAALHDDPELRDYAKVDGAAERWAGARAGVDALIGRIVRELEPAALRDAGRLPELHSAYREVFQALNAKGIVDAQSPRADTVPWIARAGRASSDAEPLLSVVMPVWSRSEELARMAERTVERVWDVARLPTEVIVVDNGSPCSHSFENALVHRFEENRGVASGWNAGIGLARAAVICVLNSDCMVEPGWDEALHEAATSGRRIAFPYTDHVDGEGFRRPDQAGTAGWCFVLTRALFDEIGPFDERFNPAYGEDTDYWHRAWELGIDLAPVPAARVVHARRTSVRDEDKPDWLLMSHRYLYGWKHGVDPLRAPPYYNREVVDYERGGREPAGLAA